MNEQWSFPSNDNSEKIAGNDNFPQSALEKAKELEGLLLKQANAQKYGDAHDSLKRIESLVTDELHKSNPSEYIQVAEIARSARSYIKGVSENAGRG